MMLHDVQLCHDVRVVFEEKVNDVVMEVRIQRKDTFAEKCDHSCQKCWRMNGTT